MSKNKDFLVSEKYIKNYENYYKGESIWREIGAVSKFKNIISLCENIPHNKILDIGSGDGSILKKISDKGFSNEIYSLEISESAVNVIRNRKIKALVDVKLFNGYNIPYKNNEFDIVILSHVLEHLEYPRKILYEAKRVAPYVFVEVPLEHTIRLKKNFHFNKVGHINYYSPKTIRILLQTCGFEIVSQTIDTSSYNVYKYLYGKKGFLKYLIKKTALTISQSIACSFWVYNSAIIAKRID